VMSEEEEDIFGTGAIAIVQELRARITSGSKEGEVVTFKNDLTPLNKGDDIYINHLKSIDGTEYYLLKDINRLGPIVVVGVVFVVLLLTLAGWQGVRALASLLLSVGAIIFLLVPALLSGYPPALASMLVSGAVLAVVLFGTHGFKPRSVIAFLGTFMAVGATCLIAYLSVGAMRLSGFSSDASIYLNFSTGGTLDFAGLLLGSIIIGVLGVLDDVAVTQASVVAELKAANPALRGLELYRRAIRVGKDHISSLVNTLALAYVGAALPLVLLFARTESDFITILNQEVVASEYVRILVGSIGLMLAVPLTTLIAAWWFHSHESIVDHDSHGHGHSHHHH
jgi:uncharacterized membrane protein